MSEIVEHPRSLCALGAQQSVAAIERAIRSCMQVRDVGISSILVLVISMDSREADIAAGRRSSVPTWRERGCFWR